MWWEVVIVGFHSGVWSGQVSLLMACVWTPLPGGGEARVSLLLKAVMDFLPKSSPVPALPIANFEAIAPVIDLHRLLREDGQGNERIRCQIHSQVRCPGDNNVQ